MCAFARVCVLARGGSVPVCVARACVCICACTCAHTISGTRCVWTRMCARVGTFVRACVHCAGWMAPRIIPAFEGMLNSGSVTEVWGPGSSPPSAADQVPSPDGGRGLTAWLPEVSSSPLSDSITPGDGGGRGFSLPGMQWGMGRVRLASGKALSWQRHPRDLRSLPLPRPQASSVTSWGIPPWHPGKGCGVLEKSKGRGGSVPEMSS